MLIAKSKILFDNEDRVLIIPTWKDEDGVSRFSMKFKKIDTGYNEYVLGNEILACLESSKKNEYEDKNQNVWKHASGLKTWKAFQKKYECVGVYIADNGKWMIDKMRKGKDGSYTLDEGDEEKYSRTYAHPLSAEELGKVVLEMLAIQ